MTPDAIHRILSTPVPLPQRLTGPITFVRPNGSEVTLDGTVDVDIKILGTTESDVRALADMHEHCDVAGEAWRAAHSLVMLTKHSMTWDEPQQRYNTTY